jgi:hypothetical protein
MVDHVIHTTHIAFMQETNILDRVVDLPEIVHKLHWKKFERG